MVVNGRVADSNPQRRGMSGHAETQWKGTGSVARMRNDLGGLPNGGRARGS